ncbi:glycosyltransferase family 4 protein [Candidatus Nomurabacteria bacterium]|jgi:glycosyltransferase involved in cell wall biosynthesis|nr:MAG: glycosyltransferase family 4 protein [Candidatus Nomurabacteria bacterium]
MKIISLGVEEGLFDESSKVRERILSYGKLFDEYHIIAFTKTKREKSQIANVSIYPIFAKNKVRALLEAYRQIKNIIQDKPKRDTVITSQDPFEIGFLAYFVAKRFAVPLQLQIHINFFTPEFKQESIRHVWQARIANYILPKATGIRSVSEQITKYLVTQLAISPEKITTLPIATDIGYFSEVMQLPRPKEIPEKAKVVLMASRFEKQKNIPLGLEAFVKLHSSVFLVLIGRGSQESVIKNLVTSLHIENKVILLPWVNDLRPWYQFADVFLLTSNYESWGMTVVESIASGTPVVATTVGCVEEIIEDGVNGYKVNVGDQDMITERLANVLYDSAFNRSDVRASLNVLDTEAYMQAYQDAFKKLL